MYCFISYAKKCIKISFFAQTIAKKYIIKDFAVSVNGMFLVKMALIAIFPEAER
jgi:hypothetical protein